MASCYKFSSYIRMIRVYPKITCYELIFLSILAPLFYQLTGYTKISLSNKREKTSVKISNFLIG